MRRLRNTCWNFLQEVLADHGDECIAWPFFTDKDGYAGTVTQKGVRQKAYHVSCEHHNGPRPIGTEAAHSCTTKSCVNPRHVRWATHRDNEADKVGHGTVNQGERQGHSKLTEIQVREIRTRVDDGEAKQDLALEFNIAPSNVTVIVQRKTWRHVI